MRPATLAGRLSASNAGLSCSPSSACSSLARLSRRKSFGKATPASRIVANLARRSAINLFSSPLPFLLEDVVSCLSLIMLALGLNSTIGLNSKNRFNLLKDCYSPCFNDASIN